MKKCHNSRHILERFKDFDELDISSPLILGFDELKCKINKMYMITININLCKMRTLIH